MPLIRKTRPMATSRNTERNPKGHTVRPISVFLASPLPSSPNQVESLPALFKNQRSPNEIIELERRPIPKTRSQFDVSFEDTATFCTIDPRIKFMLRFYSLMPPRKEAIDVHRS